MSGRNAGSRLKRAAMVGAAAIALTQGLVLASSAAAQDAPAEQTLSFDIPAGSVRDALRAYADASGLQLVYNAELDTAGASAGVSGSMSARDALSRILAGTGLSYRFVNATTVTIDNALTANGERVLEAVRVEGAQGSPYFGGAGRAAGVNGINGSRDITATEGTGSFTSGALTVGSKAPQAIKDVPQALSVLTAERLEQQNITDFQTAMRQLPGVTLVQGGTNLENTFYSRGFAITSIQVDGGAPLTTTFSGRFYSFPLIDMAQYDHVELLRGATGYYNGYGDPSGTVNLVRKKPLDHSQFLLEAQAGSWNNYRVVADATAPLALDGALRGRLIMAYQTSEYFYDLAKDDKTLISGIAELDVTPTTLVTGGISYTRQDSVPAFGGLPRYENGETIDLDRSTCLCFSWNRWNIRTTEIFGAVEQKIGPDWAAKANLTYNRQTNLRKFGASGGAVNPISKEGPIFWGSYGDYYARQLTAEFTVTGGFELLGQRQEVVVGASRIHSDGDGLGSYASMVSGTAEAPYRPYPGGPSYYYGSPDGSAPPINVFAFDPADPRYTEPADPLPQGRFLDNDQIQTGAYINLRLTPFERLHIATGLRWSRYRNRSSQVALCTSIPATGTPGPFNCVGREIGDAYAPNESAFGGTNLSWPPTISASYDLTRQLTAHVTYADVYISQGNYLDEDLNQLAPITGSDVEAGIKYQSSNGRLNVSLSGYRIRQKGFGKWNGELDFNVTPEDLANGISYYFVAPNGRRVPNGEVDAEHYCCYVSDPDMSRNSDGIDFTLDGELLRGLQVSAGYTFNRTKQSGSSYGTREGLPLLSIQPKHLYKLWVNFDFGAAGVAGPLSKLTVSGGVNGQSSAYYAGQVCVNFGMPDPDTGTIPCKSFGPPDTVPFEFTVPAYAVFSGRIDYRVSPVWSLAVNLENILDKTYYRDVGDDPSRGNWYGNPRSFTLSLRGKW